MSIEIHCPKCQKLIRAPDDAGGRHGKCPFCKGQVYIPMPTSDDDVIALAPLDPEDAKREEELRAESTRYVASLGREIKNSQGSDLPETSPGDLNADVEAFVLAMHKSQLEKAEAAVSRLKRAGSPAGDHIRALLKAKEPPALGKIPPPLAQAFLKNLLDRIA